MLYSGASTPDDGGLSSQSPPSHLRAGGGVSEEGEGKQKKEVKGGLESSPSAESTAWVDEDLDTGRVMAWCSPPWLSG